MDFSVKSVIFTFGTLLLIGCSGQRDQTARHLDELKREVSRLKAANSALGDRLEAVESRTGEAKVTDALVDDERPELETLRLEPEDPAAVESPEASSTPPEPSSPPPEAAPEATASEAPRAKITGNRQRVELGKTEAGGR